MKNDNFEPITYSYEIEPRFGEIDLYGHVNSKHYFDYIITSRWLFLENELGISSAEILKKGLAFFTKKSEMNYLRPIGPKQKVRIESFVENVDGNDLIVSYKMINPENNKSFSEGKFIFTVIDMKTNKSCELPDWANEYFFRKGE